MVAEEGSRVKTCTLAWIVVLLLFVGATEARKAANGVSTSSVSRMSRGCEFELSKAERGVAFSCVCNTVIMEGGVAIGGGAVGLLFELRKRKRGKLRKFARCIRNGLRRRCIRLGIVGIQNNERAVGSSCCSRVGGTFRDGRCLN